MVGTGWISILSGFHPLPRHRGAIAHLANLFPHTPQEHPRKCFPLQAPLFIPWRTCHKSPAILTRKPSFTTCISVCHPNGLCTSMRCFSRNRNTTTRILSPAHDCPSALRLVKTQRISDVFLFFCSITTTMSTTTAYGHWSSDFLG